MRLHQLQITAFGPFVDTVEVDFDDLSGAGLFLLAGPTGAGKTSVLDAVCFGLYGEVPGDRAAARHLRSDHAPAGVAPRVALTVTIGSRRFRFTRSPAWTRAKKRGQGTIRVQAHVVVEELVGGDWVSLTNRLDDAGLLVGDLLGMSCTQFTQVAMLPQGRFQAFLRATSTERHAVLQKLFRTAQFEDMERWLVERRSELRRLSQSAHERVVALLNRVQEVAGVAAPEDWASHDLAVAAERGELGTWAATLRERADTEAAATQARLAETTVALASAEAAREDGGRVAEAHARALAARAVLAEAEGRGDELEVLRTAVTAHARAMPVAQLARRADQTAAAALTTARELRTRVLAAAALLGAEDADLTEDRLGEAQRLAAEAKAVAEAFIPREVELARARDLLATTKAHIDSLQSRASTLEAELALLPGRTAQLEKDLAAQTARAARLPAATSAVEGTEVALTAATRVVEVGARLALARQNLATLTDQAQDLRERYHSVREQRINEMAAELAVGLASGCGCPVCGSAEHPSPATSTRNAVGRAEEDAARKAHEAADFARQAQQEALVTLETELAVAGSASGGASEKELTDRLATQRAAVVDACTAATNAASLTEALDAARSAREKLTEELSTARIDLAASRARHDQADAAVTALSTELSALLARGCGARTVEELVSEHATSAKVFDQTRAVMRQHEIAHSAAEEAAAMAAAAAEDAGFDDVAAARSAVLPADVLNHARQEVAAVEAATTAARATLADEALIQRAAAPAPDLGVLEGARRAAGAARDDAASSYSRARQRVTRLSELATDLDRELDTWAPVREAYVVAAGLSTFVEGKGPDNPQRVRLSAYVLSERLRSVVDAANERLGRMSDQRYALEHTDDRGAGEQRGGLSLLVRDDWNGTRRDPATLSGGETFVVSLALALGLADTVSHEAGGTDIDTLFIDEGFGSLDSETLEDVMDTLDSLRDGGRVVGIVSHVAELRTRVTSQLEISKHRSGSRIRQIVADG